MDQLIGSTPRRAGMTVMDEYCATGSLSASACSTLLIRGHLRGIPAVTKVKLNVDDDLINEAVEVGNHSSKVEAVKTALREYIRRATT